MKRTALKQKGPRRKTEKYIIIESYKNHPSVVNIKENVLPCSLSFDLPTVSKNDINKIVKSLNSNKAAGSDY